MYVFAFDFCISLILLQGLKNKGFGLAATGEYLSRADSPAGMRDDMLSLSVLGNSSNIGDGSRRGWVSNKWRERESQAGKSILALWADHTFFFFLAASFFCNISQSDSVICQLHAGNYWQTSRSSRRTQSKSNSSMIETNKFSLCFTEQVSVQTKMPNPPFSSHSLQHVWSLHSWRIFTFFAGKRAFSLRLWLSVSALFCLQTRGNTLLFPFLHPELPPTAADKPQAGST